MKNTCAQKCLKGLVVRSLATLAMALPSIFPREGAAAETADRNAILAQTKRALWAFGSGERDFSGFAVRQQGATESTILTAHHGPSRRKDCAKGALLRSTGARLATTEQSRYAFRFSTAPGDCDYAHDFALARIGVPMPSLSLLGIGDSVSVREPVIIAGFRNGKLRTIECEFRGLTSSQNQRALAHYHLHCPRLKFDTAGMSGGAVVSLRSGRAIGVFNSQEEYSDGTFGKEVFATPIFEGKAGRIVVGLRKPMIKIPCHESGAGKGYCSTDANGRFTRTPWMSSSRALRALTDWFTEPSRTAN